jgi:hypothetical protein
MSVLDVTSIASLEALNSGLSQYQAASGDTVRRFAPIFEEKLQKLEQLEPHFIDKVNQAADYLNYASSALYACQSNPERTSCFSERSMVNEARALLERARNNLATYHSVMSQLRDAFGSYQNAASRYAGNLQNIQSSVVPNFASLIGKIKTYFSDGGEVVGSELKDTGKIPIYNADMQTVLGQNQPIAETANVVGESGFSTAAAAGAGVVAGVSVAALSAGILLHFRNNGVDNQFASREINRVLTAKYGAPIGLLSPEKQAEYRKDYNALSAAVEADVKKQQEEEKKKQESDRLEKFKQYNSSLADKRQGLWIEANEWTLRDKVYNITALPAANEQYDAKRLQEAKDAFLKANAELGISAEESTKKMNEIIAEMQDEGFRRNASRTTTRAEMFKDVEGAVNEVRHPEKNLNISDAVSALEQPDAYYDLAIGIKNAPREWELANKKHALSNEAQVLLQNIESNDKLIAQLEKNNFEGLKISEHIANGCGSEQAGTLERAATKAGQGLDFLGSGFQSQTTSCNLHDIDYYNGVPKEIADNDFQQRSPIMGTAVKMATETSQNAYNNAQQQRLIDDILKQSNFNSQVQQFNIPEMPAAPKAEDSSLKYFQQAAKNAGISGVSSKN